MGVLDFFKREETVDETKVDDVLLTALLNGAEVDRETALWLPIVSSCVDLICTTFAVPEPPSLSTMLKSGVVLFYIGYGYKLRQIIYLAK
jgi:hypothetical protein